MRKVSVFRPSFWDSPIWQTLRELPREYLAVYLHLVHGPNSEVSGIYRISAGQIAEDCRIDTDQVEAIINDLANTGWCEYERPILWIRGAGNICDMLGSQDWRDNDRWLRHTVRHLSGLPDCAVVRRFRWHWRLRDVSAPESPLEPPQSTDKDKEVGIDRVSVGYRYPMPRQDDDGTVGGAA